MAPIFCNRSLTTLVRQLGPVALAAQVAEVDVAQFGGHDLLGGIRGGFVREMAVPAQDALLQAPGTVGTILQHLHVVICLQHERVGRADAFEHQPRGVAEVRQETNVPAPVRSRKPTGSWASCGMLNVSTMMSPTSKLAPVSKSRQASRVLN